MNKSGKGRQNFKIRNKNIGHFMKRQIPIYGIIAVVKNASTVEHSSRFEVISFFIITVTKSRNGEWRMKDGEREMWSGKRGLGNEEQEMKNSNGEQENVMEN